MSNTSGIVAVHAGAGIHPADIHIETLRICREACLEGQIAIKNDHSAINSCASSIKVLEESPVTNAGIGSNLNLAERIECDAGLMEGSSLTFGGIGAVSNIPCPSSVAAELVKLQLNPNNCLVPPSLLVGEGAATFARSCGIKFCSEKDLVTSRSIGNFQKALKQQNHTYTSLDTVGCVTLTPEGKVVAACSSGGLLLKHVGRVGHAAMFGCGCWAEERDDFVIGVSTSGCGEYLLRTQFAKSCAHWLLDRTDELPAQALLEVFQNNFVHSPLLKFALDQHKLAGAIVMLFDKRENEAELLWIHNTHSMAIGFADQKQCKSFMSQLPSNTKVMVQSCRVFL